MEDHKAVMMKNAPRPSVFERLAVVDSDGGRVEAPRRGADAAPAAVRGRLASTVQVNADPGGLFGACLSRGRGSDSWRMRLQDYGRRR